MLRRLSVVALLSAIATPSLAADLTRTSDGFTYFNKPGADLAAHDAAVRECRVLAGQLHQPGPAMGPTAIVMPNVAPLAAGIGGAIGMAIAMAIQQSIADHKGAPVNVENCMVVKGWRVVAIDDTEGKTFVALGKDAKKAQVQEWVGAETPHGAVVRTFANDAVTADQKALFTPAIHVGVQVSADMVEKPPASEKPKPGPVAPYAPQPPAHLPRMASTAKPPKALTDADLGGIPADSGLIAVTVKGDAEVGVSLQRMGKDAATPAWIDGRPSDIVVARPFKAYAKAGGGAGATYVFAAAPGRWRLESVTVNGVPFSFCLGGPAFDLTAGEAVYAGAFTPDHVAPEMALEPARAAFPPVSPVVEKLKPASWINGVQGSCRGSFFYVLELPDRPYADGYDLGTRAQPPAAKPAPTKSPASAAEAATPAPAGGR